LSIRERSAALLETLRATGRDLSWPTRLIGGGYVLYVLGVWVLSVAPGQTRFDGARVEPVGLASPGRIDSVLRADEQVLVVNLAPEGVDSSGSEAKIGVLDLSRDDPMTPVAVVTGAGRAQSAARRGEVVHILGEDAETRHAITVSLADGSVEQTAVHPTALWVLADGTTFGHGLYDWLVQQDFDFHVAAAPAVVSGEQAAVRIGAADGQLDEQGRFVVPPSPDDKDLLVADADNGEVIRHLPTGKIDTLVPSPRRSAFVLLEQGYPTFYACRDDPDCAPLSFHIRTETYPIRAIDHADDLDRIAVCTPTEVYVYEGEPGAEDTVFLGRAPVDLECDTIAVVDAVTVLVVSSTAGARLVRFTEDA
jgi:hypothetical protein